MTVTISLVVKIPYSTGAASQLTNTLTLTNEDGSYSQTLSFASDCKAAADGTSTLTFEGLTDGHTYSLQGTDESGTYAIFTSYPFHDLVPTIGVNGATGAGGAAAGT